MKFNIARRLQLLVVLWALLLSGGQAAASEATVIRVIDGDTIHVRIDGRIEKVRYIGINTPEIHHPTRGKEPYGKAAAEANRRLVEGKTVPVGVRRSTTG